MQSAKSKWLTFNIWAAIMATTLSAAQSHFLFGPFTKLLQNRQLEEGEISQVLAISSVFSIAGALIVMLWSEKIGVKRMTMLSYAGNTACLSGYLAAFHSHSMGVLMVTVICHTWCSAVGYGGVSTIFRLALPKDSSNHQKGCALQTTFWAVAATLANASGFMFIEYLEWWVVIGAALNLMTLLSVVSVKLPTTQQNKEKLFVVPKKEWGRLAKRQIPAVGVSLGYVFFSGYASLYIDKNWLAGVCIILFILSIQVGSWISPFTSAKWGEKATMAVCECGLLAAFLLAWAYTITPFAIFSGALVAGIAYGAHSNAHGYLLINSTAFKGAAVGTDKLVYTLTGLFAAVLFGWVGKSSHMWLMGIPFVAIGLLLLPKIGYPPVDNGGDEASSELEKQ